MTGVTVVWRQPISQCQCNFHLKAALPLVKRLAIVSDRSSDIGPGQHAHNITITISLRPNDVAMLKMMLTTSWTYNLVAAINDKRNWISDIKIELTISLKRYRDVISCINVIKMQLIISLSHLMILVIHILISLIKFLISQKKILYLII